MNKILLSENALKEAAAAVRRSMLDSLPPPSQCEREFSDIFLARMKRLVAKAKLRRGIRRSFQRAAVFFLAVLVGTGIWLTVDVEARAQFSQWFRGFQETWFVYRFTGEDTGPMDSAGYEPSRIPKGYAKTYEEDTGGVIFREYTNEEGRKIYFDYVYDPSSANIFVSTENAVIKQTTVNGHPADLLLSADGSESNTIMWADDNNYAFCIDGWFSERELIKIAQSVYEK